METVEQAQYVAKILENFAHGLNLLDDFDHKELDTKEKTTKEILDICSKKLKKYGYKHKGD